MRFRDRFDAADRLMPHLEHLMGEDVVVMGIPRGAVPMARRIADRFGWPLGVVLVKKIGHPHDPEYAIGAVGLDAEFVDRSRSEVSTRELNAAIDHARAILRKRAHDLLGATPPIQLGGRTVVIVDDGVATGATMSASVMIVRAARPKRIIVAAPVASSLAVDRIRDVADACVILHEDDAFGSVGMYYEDFSEVTDDDVRRALAAE